VTAADVDRARNEEGSLLRAWMMRETAHLIATEDARWILPLYLPAMGRLARKRLIDFGVEAAKHDKVIRDVRRWLADGPLPRSEVIGRLVDQGLPADVQTRYRLIGLIIGEAGVCLGPDSGREDTFVLSAEWIGEQEPSSRADSLAELARRYLRAYGPADERDLSRWAGLPLRDTRLGFERIERELSEVRVGGETMLRLGRGARRVAPGPQVRLLGAFDNYNLGYRSREFATSPDDAKRISPGGGIIHPTITVDGRIVGTWSSKRSGKGLVVTLEAFDRLEPAWRDQLEAEVADIGRFEGVEAVLAGP
jgi:hypothetical protein